MYFSRSSYDYMYIEERRVIAVFFFGRNLRSHLSEEYTIIV